MRLQKLEANKPKSNGVYTSDELSALTGIRSAREQKLTRMKNKLKNEALLESKRKRLKSTLKLWEKGFETTEKLDEIKAEVKGLEIDLDQDKDLQKELADLKMTEKKIIESAKHPIDLADPASAKASARIA